MPLLIYFWRRQASRRTLFPSSPGWTLYLSLMELVFTTAFVVTAVIYLHELFTDNTASAWTGAVVFGAIVVFHEYAATTTPPRTDAGELRRVVGSAIGLVTATIGLTGMLAWLLDVLYKAVGGPALDPGFSPWLAMLIVGVPLWWYRWLRPWEAKPAIPRTTWTIIVSTFSLATALGSATTGAVLTLQYLFADTQPAGLHFSNMPIVLALVVSGTVVWRLHRRHLGDVAGIPVQVYEHTMAGIGLVTAVSMATALTIATFDQGLIVGGGTRDVVTSTAILLAGLAVWLYFGMRREPAQGAMSWPRRIYTLGLGIAFGLVAAGALITTVFIFLRRLLGDGRADSLLEPGVLFLYSGLATWYLLRSYAAGRDAAPSEDVVAPFAVTIVCSHPGMIATMFHEHARLKVIHRGDDLGIIDAEMADQIVSAVANRPSLVWVDEDGFRVAPLRVST
jgi:hypothetical protein